ncbi:MAG TPA: Uma2 family endonuclease [Polyangiaceae bacterium]|nr:Uma2 family endonuclease [Polyangiaceae bacterium]
MLAQLLEHDDTPAEDSIVVMHGVRWSDYERVLAMRGEAPVPRLAYLEGELEFMTPSQPHESIKSRIGRLLEVWCLENGIEFSAYGSWTVKKKTARTGLEPDECYVFGRIKESRRPHLAIEVVWTSGGVSKLDGYAKLRVKEVWFWRRGRISVHVLEEAGYVDSASSRALPGIDLVQLASFLDRETDSQAIREYRAALLEG